jgi:hypothetical protein
MKKKMTEDVVKKSKVNGPPEKSLREMKEEYALWHEWDEEVEDYVRVKACSVARGMELDNMVRRGIVKGTMDRECVADDWIWLLEQMYIKDKNTQMKVRFKFTDAQRKMFKELFAHWKKGFWNEGSMTLLLKSRQFGGSTLISLINYVITWAFHGYGANIISYDDTQANWIFAMYDRAWKKDVLKREKKNVRNMRKLEYADDEEGVIQVFSGYTENAGRGFTVPCLHCSEIDMWRIHDQALAALLPSRPNIPGAQLFVESTAKGKSAMYDLWKKDHPALLKIFIGWLMDDTCRRSVSVSRANEIMENLDSTEEMLLSLGASVENLEFRRFQLIGMSPETFRQEYPATAEEAFVYSNQSFFGGNVITVLGDTVQKFRDKQIEIVKDEFRQGEIMIHKNPLRPWEYTGGFKNQTGGRCIVYKNPLARHCYCLSCDVAEGKEIAYDRKERDNTCFQIWDYDVFMDGNAPVRELVMIWTGKIEPDDVAYMIDLSARKYNMALVVAEINHGHGQTVLKKLCGTLDDHDYWKNRDENDATSLRYPRNYLYRRNIFEEGKPRANTIREIGWRTTGPTRPIMLDTLNNFAKDNRVIMYDEGLLDEMNSFIVTKSGRPEAMNGHHDDRVITAAMAMQVMTEVPPRYEIAKKERTETQAAIDYALRRNRLRPGQAVNGLNYVK